MNRGLVNLKVLRENAERADFTGTTAFCFVKGNKIIKIYARRGQRGYFNPLDPNKICDLSMYRADTIVFPDEYIYEKGLIVGEISKYIKSKSVNKAFRNLANIKSIIENYDLVINDLYLYKDINMVDLCYVNVLFSNKTGFHIIDTTEWNIKANSLERNIYHFNSSLTDAFVEAMEIPITYSKYYNRIDSVYLNNLDKYGNFGKELKDSMYLLMNSKYNFIKLLLAYINTYRLHYGADASTLNDIKEFTKVLKKG